MKKIFIISMNLFVTHAAQSYISHLITHIVCQRQLWKYQIYDKIRRNFTKNSQIPFGESHKSIL